MPKIFEYFGFVFFFYSNDHEPIHVHVIRGDRQSVFEIYLDEGKVLYLKQRNVVGCSPLHLKDAKVAESFINVYSLQIVEKWIDFFVLKKTVSCTEVNKKIQ